MSGVDIEGVLAGHGFVVSGVCACGEAVGLEHRAHVAAVLREEIAAWLGSEGAEDVAADALIVGSSGPIPAHSLARGALDALAAQLAPARVPGGE